MASKYKYYQELRRMLGVVPAKAAVEPASPTLPVAAPSPLPRALAAAENKRSSVALRSGGYVPLAITPGPGGMDSVAPPMMAPLPAVAPPARPAVAAVPATIDYNAAFTELEKNAALAENKEEAMQHAVQLVIEDELMPIANKIKFLNQKIDSAMLAKAMQETTLKDRFVEVFNGLDTRKQYEILHSPELSFVKKCELYQTLEATDLPKTKALDTMAAAAGADTQAAIFQLKDPSKQLDYMQEDVQGRKRYETAEGQRLLITTGGAALSAPSITPHVKAVMFVSISFDQRAELLSNAITNHPDIKEKQAEIARLEAEEAKSPSPTTKPAGAAETRREKIARLKEESESKIKAQISFAAVLIGEPARLEVLQKMSPVAKGRLFASFSQGHQLALREQMLHTRGGEPIRLGALRDNDWTTFLRSLPADSMADYLDKLAPDGPDDVRFNDARNDFRRLDDPVKRAHVIGALVKSGKAKLALRLLLTSKGRRFLPAAPNHGEMVELFNSLQPPEARGALFAELDSQGNRLDQTEYRLLLGMGLGATLSSIGMGLGGMSFLYGLGSTAGLLAALTTPACILLAAGAVIFGICALWFIGKRLVDKNLTLLTDANVEPSARGEMFNGLAAERMLHYRDRMNASEWNEFLNMIPPEHIVLYFDKLLKADPEKNYAIVKNDFRRIENPIKRAQVLEEFIKKDQEKVASKLFLESRAFGLAPPNLAEQVQIFQNISPEAATKLFAQIYKHNNADATDLRNGVGMALGIGIMGAGIGIGLGTGLGAGLGTAIGIGGSIGLGALAVSPMGAAIFLVGAVIFLAFALSQLFKPDNNMALLSNPEIDIKTRVAMLTALPMEDQVKYLTNRRMDTAAAVELFQELSKQDPKKATELYRTSMEKIGGALNFFSNRLQKMFDGVTPAARAELAIDLAKNKGLVKTGELLASMKDKQELAKTLKELSKIAKMGDAPSADAETKLRATWARELQGSLFRDTLENRIFSTSNRRDLLNAMGSDVAHQVDLILTLDKQEIAVALLKDDNLEQKEKLFVELVTRGTQTPNGANPDLNGIAKENKGAVLVAKTIGELWLYNNRIEAFQKFAKACDISDPKQLQALKDVMLNLPTGSEERKAYINNLPVAMKFKLTEDKNFTGAYGAIPLPQGINAASLRVSPAAGLPAAAPVAAPTPSHNSHR